MQAGRKKYQKLLLCYAGQQHQKFGESLTTALTEGFGRATLHHTSAARHFSRA